MFLLFFKNINHKTSESFKKRYLKHNFTFFWSEYKQKKKKKAKQNKFNCLQQIEKCKPNILKQNK